MTIETLYQIYLTHRLITSDSRKIENGAIFFSLKGENFNGNAYAQMAIENGASYAIVDEKDFADHERIILVENVLQTLQNLARFHRQKLGIPVLAITGTNGKTTTKELAASVLSKKFKVVYTRGNLNNHIGVPLTLLSMPLDTEFAVIEMGANHPGEIRELCEIALPNFGLITNVGRAHLEGFGSFEGVIQTKTELYRFLETNHGHIFINLANPILKGKCDKIKKTGYSTMKDPEALEGEAVSANPFLIFKVLFPKGWLYIKTKLAGRYNLENALAAAAIGQYFGIEPTEIAYAIENYQPDNNRSQMLNTQRNNLLLDAYNANPSSTKAALENFAQLDAPKKGVILGDMLELGSAARNEHQTIVDLLTTLKLDLVCLTGPNYCASQFADGYHCFRDVVELSLFLKEKNIKGYLLLIKGSRGMKLETIVPEL